jgi:hypothetical protein
LATDCCAPFLHRLSPDYNRTMERESLDYKIVMDDGPDTEVLGRLASLDIASAAYLQAIVKYPLRNVQLRQGEHIIKRHDGEPKPEPPKDPNLKSWSAHLIGGKKMQLLGFVEAVSEPAAIEAAVVVFSLDDQKRRRLAINLRRQL